MPVVLRPKAETTLLLFLKEELSEWRLKTLKERLKRQCISVNGEVVTHHAFILQKNDEIAIHKSPIVITQPKGGIHVLYEDAALVGIYKPEGLLSVGTDRVRSRHALAMVRDALGPHQKLWPVHRLDRETSGVLLFARSRDSRDALQSKWSEVHKVYSAVVEGHPAPPEGVIDQPLYEDKNLLVRVGSHPMAKDARTRYRTRETGVKRALLEIHLETGRRHQIRAHLAWLGHPVVGDARYGQPDSRMALHAQRLSFQHPVTHERVLLETPPPALFSKLLRQPS